MAFGDENLAAPGKEPNAFSGKQGFTDWVNWTKQKSLQSSMGNYGGSEKFLPPELRGLGGEGGPIAGGLQGIGDMIRHPGQLSPTALRDVQPRLGQEFHNIGQNYQNLASENRGAAARGNTPVSIKNALQKALGFNQGRAQQEATGQALQESDQLRHADVGQTYNLLDSILQYISSGRGQAIPGTQAANAMQQQAKDSSRAANTAMIGSLLQAFGGGGM